MRIFINILFSVMFIISRITAFDYRGNEEKDDYNNGYLHTTHIVGRIIEDNESCSRSLVRVSSSLHARVTQ